MLGKVSYKEEGFLIKVVNQLPKENKVLHNELMDHGWKVIKEPSSSAKALLLSIPFLLINTILVIGVINLFSMISLVEYGISDDGFHLSIQLIHIVWIIGMLICHEFIHLILVPNFLKSNKTIIGITFIGGFVYTEEAITRTRYIIITVAPFIALSILLPILLGLLGALTPILKFILF